MILLFRSVLVDDCVVDLKVPINHDDLVKFSYEKRNERGGNMPKNANREANDALKPYLKETPALCY